VLSLDGVLAPNLKVAINKRNGAGHGRRLCCRDFSPIRRGDILGLVTRRFPEGVFLCLVRRIAIRQRGLSNRDLVQLGARRAIAIDRNDYGIGFHRHDWLPRGRIRQAGVMPGDNFQLFISARQRARAMLSTGVLT